MKKTFLVVVLIFGALFAGYSLTKPSSCGASCGVQIISTDAQRFSEKAKNPTVKIIDVRTTEEYAQGHLKNAVNANFNNQTEFQTYLDSLDKKATYLIYCRTGNRSGQAMKMMEENGFTNIINLEGGIVSWQASGMSLEN